MTETEALDRYIEEHSASEGDYLYRLWRAENIHTIHGRMSSGHVEGRVLKMLVQMIRPRTILEIGTFCGYSAICMAEGLADIEKAGSMEEDTALSASAFCSGEKPTIQPMVYTFEINDELEDFTRSWIEGSPVADYICFTIGDAKVEACFVRAVIYWLIIRFGTAMWLTRPTTTMHKHKEYASLTISWHATRASNRLFCPCVTV